MHTVLTKTKTAKAVLVITTNNKNNDKHHMNSHRRGSNFDNASDDMIMKLACNCKHGASSSETQENLKPMHGIARA